MESTTAGADDDADAQQPQALASVASSVASVSSAGNAAANVEFGATWYIRPPYSRPPPAAAASAWSARGGDGAATASTDDEDLPDRAAVAADADWADTSSVSQFSSVSKYLERDDDGGEEGEDSGDESDDDDDDEDLEPKLKYQRLASDLKTILERDAATCIVAHAKFLVLGSRQGMLHLMDAMGNLLPSYASQAHSVHVNQISTDHYGEFVASCSQDGRVIVAALMSGDGAATNSHNFVLERAVRSIAIDPLYKNSNYGRRFMTGDDRVILHEKSFFTRKQTVICEGEGPIATIKWRGQFAAWSTTKGVWVYDVVDYARISLIKYPAGAWREDVPVRIAWHGKMKLLVSSGDTVQVCVVRKRSIEEARKMELPQHKVEIVSHFRLDDQWVCGVAPFNDLVVALTVPKARSTDGKAQKPQLVVVQPGATDFGDYTVISTDLLSIRGYEDYRPKDYHLECLVEDKQYFIVSPRDVVQGRERDLDDHIGWLVEHARFAEALDKAEEGAKKLKGSVLDVGRKYLDHLLEEELFDEAAALCHRVFGKDKALWQKEVFRFADLKQLKAIARHLPCGDSDSSSSSFRLDKSVYEMVLFDFLNTDDAGFLKWVRTWTTDLYNIDAVVKAVVEELLLSPDNATLLRALATLYERQSKYDKAMAMYLKLRHEDVFTLIRKHALYKACYDKLEYLIDLDADESLKLFLEHPSDGLEPRLVVERMEARDPRFLHRYLAALCRDRKYGDETKAWHGRLIELTAEFGSPSPSRPARPLLTLLQAMDREGPADGAIPLEKALAVCVMRGMTEERIFLLKKMGNAKEALELCCTELFDIDGAVELCKEYDDPELWNYLIAYSLDKPVFITTLLDNIGTHVDPNELIEKIAPGLEIPGLRDSLCRIMHDYNLQISLQEGCKKILVSDCFSLLQKQFRIQSRGVAVQEETSCCACGGRVAGCGGGGVGRSGGAEGGGGGGGAADVKDVVVFMCHHAYHVDCLQDDTICAICHPTKASAAAKRLNLIGALAGRP